MVFLWLAKLAMPAQATDDGMDDQVKGRSMVEGLSHVTFIVRNLDRMEEILGTVFDATKVYDSGDQTFSLSKERFFLIGKANQPIWVAIMEGEQLPTRTYNHVAF